MKSQSNRCGQITSFRGRERLFCIFDQDKPFTLKVSYYSPKTESSLAPTFTYTYTYTGFGMGFAHYENTSLEQTITKRFASEEMLQQDIVAIQKMQEK